MTLKAAAAICHGPAQAVRRVPVGHDACDKCSGFGDRYEPLPRCADCGEAVCPACRVESTLREGDEGRRTCLCKACFEPVVRADYEADGDLETAAPHREGE